MKTVTMLEFRQHAAVFLRRIAKGETFVLSHRGRPDARLEPVTLAAAGEPGTDPFLTIGQRATPSPKGRTRHEDIDEIVYGSHRRFVDRSGFLALWDTSDGQHESALRVQGELARKRRRFVTTDYINDKLLHYV